MKRKLVKRAFSGNHLSVIRNPRVVVLVLLVTFGLSTIPPITSAQGQPYVQVGGLGDDASRSNMGVQVGIRTHKYDSYPMVFDYFWVGSGLSNGGFLQFGYGIQPGYFCLMGALVHGEFTCLGRSEVINYSDTRWEWQYWPNIHGTDFYYGIGPTDSVGDDGSWHSYSIAPNSEHVWDFILDGKQVGSIAFQTVPSKDPPSIIAEKVTEYQLLGNLGPAEFRNLSYLKEDGWHHVDSIVTVENCAGASICNTRLPYGLMVKGPNDILVGSGLPERKNGELLWTSGYVTLNVKAHPSTQFSVTSVSGNQEFDDQTSVKVPKGMFADVSLSATRTPSAGIIGMLGGMDDFQGWVGAVSSRNASVRLLMDSDKSLQATWSLNSSDLLPRLLLIVVVPVLIVLAIIGYRFEWRRNRSRVPDLPASM